MGFSVKEESLSGEEVNFQVFFNAGHLPPSPGSDSSPPKSDSPALKSSLPRLKPLPFRREEREDIAYTQGDCSGRGDFKQWKLYFNIWSSLKKIRHIPRQDPSKKMANCRWRWQEVGGGVSPVEKSPAVSKSQNSCHKTLLPLETLYFHAQKVIFVPRGRRYKILIST